MSVPTASYLESVDDVVASFETTSTGLTTAQADEHRARSGSNVIVEVTHESGLRRYLRQ